jgi:Ni,Fe-hydrogenase maturation factor
MRIKKGGRAEETNNNNEDIRKNQNSNIGISLRNIIAEQKKYSAKELRLKDMTWGMGLEHEVQYFYLPISADTDKKYPASEIVLFKSLKPAQNLPKTSKIITESEKKLLSTVVYEKTGRKCMGKVILERIPAFMPEFITGDPFSNMEDPKTIENYYLQLMEKEAIFEKIMEKDPAVYNFIKNKFKLIQYPFGMCSNIRLRKNYKGDSPELRDKVYRDYVGSFHYTITLPFEKKETYTEKDQEKFRNMHYNFGAMFQWIEPLLLAAYFSCDQEAMGTKKKKIRGSFRVARVGWGNFAGSDMRKKTTGVGRYADILPYWRKNFQFDESEIVDQCTPRNPGLEEDQAVSSFSSNIRTFGPPTPNKPKNRVSGAKMTIPNGVEIRIFDHFPTIYLLSLLQIIILIAANSATTIVKDFVYEDKEWITTLQQIMLQGWKYNVSDLFIQKIKNVLGLQVVKFKSRKAYDVLCGLVDALFEKNKDSDIVFMMYGALKKPFIPSINKHSWDFAFMLKLLKDKDLYKRYLIFIDKIIDETDVDVFKKKVVEVFGDDWKNNADDILWFLEGKHLLSLEKNETKYSINKKLMREFLTPENIGLEVKIILAPNSRKLDSNTNKNSFFSKNNIKKRFKNLFNHSNIKLSS